MEFNNQDQFRTCNPVCYLFVIKSHVINRAERTVLPERLVPWCVDDKKTRKLNVKRLELKQEIRTRFFMKLERSIYFHRIVCQDTTSASHLEKIEITSFSLFQRKYNL